MRNVTPEQCALARQDYVEGKAVRWIEIERGLTKSGVYFCLEGGPPDARGQRLPKIMRRVVAGPRPKRLSSARAALINRLWRTADRQVRDIEKRLHLDGQDPDERERDARVLATTVKTLRDLRALDAAHAEQEPSPQDDQGPDNLDDFRRELARKMDAIAGSETAGVAGNADRQ
jgi:hypothetical protein